MGNGPSGGARLKYRCPICYEVLASRYAHLFSHTKYWVVFMHQDGSGQDDDGDDGFGQIDQADDDDDDDDDGDYNQDDDDDYGSGQDPTKDEERRRRRRERNKVAAEKCR